MKIIPRDEKDSTVSIIFILKSIFTKWWNFHSEIVRNNDGRINFLAVQTRLVSQQFYRQMSAAFRPRVAIKIRDRR